MLIQTAPPFLTVQDLGRSGFRAAGVPRAGAMDRDALAVANILVGNPVGAAGLEWALGGGSVVFESPALFAVTGARTTLAVDGVPREMDSAIAAEAGAVLDIDPPHAGRFLYLAVAGGIEVPPVLGSRSTYLPGRFGGWEGRRIPSSTRLARGRAEPRPHPNGITPATFSKLNEHPIRMVRGPQDHLLHAGTLELLTGTTWSVGAADRMGYRLEGAHLPAPAVAGIPSEPMCPGAIQLPPDGRPIVLMADAPTVGGYPKLGAVLDVDLGRLAQAGGRITVGFALVPIEEAQRAYRERNAELRSLTERVERPPCDS